MAVYLAYSGMQNMFLTDNPDFTHFKTLFSREMEYTTQVVEQTFDKAIAYRPGDTLIATLKQNGDYLSNISFKLRLPQLTPNSTQYWIYENPPSGIFYGYSSTNQLLFTITMLGLTAKSNTVTWFFVSSGSVTVSVTDNKFTFSTSGTLGYVVFSSIELANFWGFSSNVINLFGGYVRFNTGKSQITFQESGWLQGSIVYGSEYSYLDDTVYKFINSISLYIGNQLVQEFDSEYLKFYNDTTNTYKNRPVNKLLYGNDNVVDFDRYYYFNLPFIQIPVYTIPRHLIKIYVKTNPFNYINFYASLVASFDYFSDTTKLPKEYTITVPQVSFFNRDEKLDIKNPMKKIIFNQSGTFVLNGEFFSDSDLSNISCFENLLNLPTQSNAIVFNNTINMSRIRDQVFNSNSDVHAETLNVLRCSNEIAGLLFDFKDSNRYPLLTGNFINPASQQEVYLFDQIPSSLSKILNFCSLRRLSPGYTGPVVRLRVNNNEDDFYTDSIQSYLKNSSGVSVDTWSNGSTVYVVIWYDQFLYANHIYQDDRYYQPTLVKENDTYVISITNSTTQFIPPTQYLKITYPLYIQQFAVQFKPDYRQFSSLFSNQTDYRFFMKYNDFYGDNSSFDWVNFPGAGTVYWLNNNQSGEGYIDPSVWTTLTSYATNLPSYDSTIGGPITDFGKRNILFTADQTFSGKIFEIGFFSGSTMSSDGSVYYENRKNI